MPPWARSSELERLTRCPGALFLPHTLIKSKKSHEAADWGTMVHRWKATRIIRGQEDYPNHGWRLRERLDLVDTDGGLREEFWPSSGRHEVGVGISTLHSSVAENEEKDEPTLHAWKMGLPDDWVVGTLDYTGFDYRKGMPWIDDLKTGNPYFAPDPDSPQLLFYALAQYRLFTEEYDEVLLSITSWPRYPKGNRPEREELIISSKVLRKFEEKLRRVYAWVSGRRQNPDPLTVRELRKGEHCTFCPSKPNCVLQQGE